MNTNTNAASVPGPEDQKFNAWYESKFKPAMERGPLDKYVARQAWFAALSTAAQPPASYEHQHAIMEGERNDSLRIHIEQANGSSTPCSERAYETGFINGWNRALAAAPKAEPQGKADASPLNSAAPVVKAEPVPLTDEQCDSIIANLDQVGRDIDHYECGLPVLHGEDARERMRDAVRDGIQPAHKEQP